MCFRLLFLITVSLLWSVVLLPSSTFGFSQQERHEEITFNSDLGSFTGIPETEAGVDSLLSYGIEMRDRDSRVSFYAAKEALVLSKELNYRAGEAQANNLAANKYLDFGDYEHALEHYLLGYDIEEELGNHERMANIKITLLLFICSRKIMTGQPVILKKVWKSESK